MSFQAYLDNIEDKTGLTSRQFIALVQKKGFNDSSTKVVHCTHAAPGELEFVHDGRARPLVSRTLSLTHDNRGVAGTNIATTNPVGGQVMESPTLRQSPTAVMVRFGSWTSSACVQLTVIRPS